MEIKDAHDRRKGLDVKEILENLHAKIDEYEGDWMLAIEEFKSFYAHDKAVGK